MGIGIEQTTMLLVGQIFLILTALATIAISILLFESRFQEIED